MHCWEAVKGKRGRLLKAEKQLTGGTGRARAKVEMDWQDVIRKVTPR